MLSPNNLKDKVESKDFVLFRLDDIEIYIHKELMDNNEIEFTISSVGKFTIIFKENNNGDY